MTTDNLWNRKALSLSRHLTRRWSFSRDPSKTDKLSHWVDQATPPQLAERYTYPPNQNIWRFWAQLHVPLLRRCRASLAVAATYESPTVHTAVTSQARGLPAFQGTSVRPSGRFPSDRTKPCGSLELGIPAEVKARATRSFNAWCLVIFLEPFYTRSREDHVRQPKTHSGSCELYYYFFFTFLLYYYYYYIKSSGVVTYCKWTRSTRVGFSTTLTATSFNSDSSGRHRWL